MPVGSALNRPLGKIKFVMRLRKGITEQMKMMRDHIEISNITRAVEMKQSSLRVTKRMVTINIMGATNLKTKYPSSQIAPFFYYQFFSFDEVYSSNGVGINPKFSMSKVYEVSFDAKAVEYFEREELDVILFDDNAPVAGLSSASAGLGDDIIGICKIPLKSLINGLNTHEHYNVK